MTPDLGPVISLFHPLAGDAGWEYAANSITTGRSAWPTELSPYGQEERNIMHSILNALGDRRVALQNKEEG
ncbi:hypothetical protein ACC691_37230, partial [Rhizobium johnstonii]|uniref:hypothetical protein n=1 Tax=Rhizobium johnstonii TaxID=3019933 RepID=UPI003F979B81